MRKPSRRDFLVHSAAGGALAFHGASAHGQEAAAAEMCIARWKDAADPTAPTDIMAPKLVRQAMDAIGGMKRFVSKGDVVWVKPNMAWDRTPEQAANTNPDLVAAIVKMCFEAGAKQVKVGDNTCNDASASYTRSGIEAAAKAAGAEVVYVDQKRFKNVDIGGEKLKTSPIYPEMIDTDLLISVPVAKHHRATGVTLCMKNYMGVVENRRRFHQDLPGCIRDLTAYLKPRISILDAIRILTANGPTGGDLGDVKRLNTIAVGTDIVALDALGAELLGNQPKDIGTIVAGHEAGLGDMDYRKIAKEIVVS